MERQSFLVRQPNKNGADSQGAIDAPGSFLIVSRLGVADRAYSV